MYTIYADGQLVYAPTLSGEGYAAISPKVEVEVNKAGSAGFVLPPGNVMYDRIQKLKSVVTIYDRDEEIFRGRVLHDEKDFYNRKDIYCEGELAFLMDTIVRPYSHKGGVEALFRKFVDNHNSQVDSWKQFRPGIVTVTDPNDYIARASSGYPNSADEMNAKLVKLLGGYLRPRLSEGIRYLDYVEEYGSVSGQAIEFGRNLLDISEYISAEDVFTVLIPLGADQQDADGNSAGKLTITSVNDGKDYIEDSNAVSLFGRIVRIHEWDNVTLATNLLRKGKQYLAEGIEMAVSLSIKAVDLHLLDVDTDRIKLGDYIRVISLPHRLDKYFLCSKISYDLVNPQNTEFTLGAAFTSLTDRQTGQQKAAQSTFATIQSVAQSAQDSAAQASNTVKQVEQVIVQMPDDYVKADVFRDYQDEINGRLSDCAAKEEIPDVPSSVSELENDAGYLTGKQAEADYVKLNIFEDLVRRVSALEGSD